MTRQTDPTPLTHPSHRRVRTILGAGLFTIGLILLLEQTFKTGWLSLIVIPGAGFLMLVAGFRTGRMNLVIPGSILTGLGAGLFYIFHGESHYPFLFQVAVLLLALGLGWFVITLLSALIDEQTAWWSLIPGAIGLSLGYGLLDTPPDLLDLGFYLFTSLGAALLLWGIAARLFGLIIPGCLLISLGPGLHLAWGRTTEPTALSQTGVLLVSFAIGWVLITLFSRAITAKFTWWPLIPGGVLAMVGWGLYIGGNPGNAVNFLGNTGSLGLVIFGLYLLLWHKGFRK